MRRPAPAFAGLLATLGPSLGLAAALGLALTAAAGAQERATPRVHELPSGDGTVRGRVVHRTRPEAAAGVEVFLYGLRTSGNAGLRTTRSDAEGRFAFAGVSSKADFAYLLVARYDGVPYPGARLRFEAGGSLELEGEITIADTTRDASRVSRVESRMLVDPDAAAFLVREAHTIAVEGDEWVVAPEGGRLLHVPLPAGVEALRFEASLALGMAPDPAGGLAVTGPLPPGESTLNLQYRLPASARLARRFGDAVPLVSIYVADSGDLLLESDRLHRRRPVRTDGRVYALLEAFEVEADEEILLSLGRLPPRATLSRPALLGLFALLSAGVIGAVVAPLRGPPSDEEEHAPEQAASRRERDAVYEALRDLDHDHETQKIADEDYALLGNELRARAVALLRAEKEASRTAAAVSTPPRCSSCRADLRPADRFCAHCGATVAPLDEPGAAGAPPSEPGAAVAPLDEPGAAGSASDESEARG